MKINGIVEKKLLLLEEKLKQIDEWKIEDYSSFKNSSLQVNAVERALTVCVEIMIDVIARLLALKEIPPKDTSVEKLEQIEKIGCIEFAGNYSEMIKFRNIIVHRYENIDPEILFNIITNQLDDYKNFIDEIRNYCKDKNNS